LRLTPLFGEWLGSGADEGRAKLRNAPGRRKEPVIRGLPNRTSCSQERSVRNGNPRDRSILVRGGRETNRDALSKGDRRGHRANRTPRGNARGVWSLDLGTPGPVNPKFGVNAGATEGESPVGTSRVGDSRDPE